MRSVLVIGARGVLGSLIADALAQDGWMVRRGVRAAPEGPDEVLLDLDRPDTLAPALGGTDLVVTTVQHPQLVAERHVLEHGGTLLSVVALTRAETRPLAALAQHARGTVVPNAGIMPGLTNLAAAELLRSHPGADGVELVLTASASGTRGRAGGAFAYDNLRTRARHRTVAVPLPAPLGRRTCIEFAEGCDGWLGDLADGREVHSHLLLVQRLPQRGLLAANAAGACRLLPRGQFAGERRAGADGASRDPVAEWVAVTRAGRRLAAMTVECEGDYRGTATAIAAFAEAAHGRELPPGCHEPQQLFTVEELAARLAQDGVRIVPQHV
ncbi:MAG TPA: hypothetical protein VN635_12815 [Conexibacter sp.]|nr:hypothetical protein [Conexibacter sp.]